MYRWWPPSHCVVGFVWRLERITTVVVTGDAERVWWGERLEWVVVQVVSTNIRSKCHSRIHIRCRRARCSRSLRSSRSTGIRTVRRRGTGTQLENDTVNQFADRVQRTKPLTRTITVRLYKELLKKSWEEYQTKTPTMNGKKEVLLMIFDIRSLVKFHGNYRVNLSWII